MSRRPEVELGELCLVHVRVPRVAKRHNGVSVHPPERVGPVLVVRRWRSPELRPVEFLLGECPEEALRANLGARLMGLRKPNGKLRPVAMGSVVRRLAARAACAVVKDSLAASQGATSVAGAGCARYAPSAYTRTTMDVYKTLRVGLRTKARRTSSTL